MADLRARTASKQPLRILTCGSVDDGKSTLIGHLLLEGAALYDDQLQTLVEDSRRYGTQGAALDLALAVDGLQAEREQGITIDVAYRYFAAGDRQYVLADTPGHEQYTCNMATGASTADVAIMLIDARKGLLVQTRRHLRIVALMGLRHVVLAVNKMDLVEFKQSVFDEHVAAFTAFAAGLALQNIQAIPLSALRGDNLRVTSAHTPWYAGPSLLQHLHSLPARESAATLLFRMPVQWINRPNADFRGYSGTLAAGTLNTGDAICVLPPGVQTNVKAILNGSQTVTQAHAGDAVTLTLADEVDVSRGNWLAAIDAPPQAAGQFQAKVLWMAKQPLTPGRQYLLKMACQEITATITTIKYRIDVDTGAHLAARMLQLNEIATVNLSTGAPLLFEPYATNRTLGGFILIDKLTCATVGAGMIDFALRRASNLHWQTLEIDKQARATQKLQRPRCIWFTGLSGSGKSTIANLLEERLHAEGMHTYVLDGDNVRHGLNRDLGFTEADRVENIRRVAEVSHLMVDAGLIVINAFISPFVAERAFARSLFQPGEFIEVFVDAPLQECMRRDPKGLYAKAARGELQNFTGIDSAYEPPQHAEIHLNTASAAPGACVEQIMAWLRAR